jgi:hypothetical protein
MSELRYKAPMAAVIAEFAAPWSRSLRALTIASVALLLSLASIGLLFGRGQPWLWWAGTLGAPLITLCGTLLFMVRGYVLTDRQIEVRRLGWSTVLPLAGLGAVTGEPQGLTGSLRLFGNGGLFAISGWFWNRRIGRFRAYATDPQRAVLLRYRDGAQVILTPDDVQHFIVQVRRLAHMEERDG